MTMLKTACLAGIAALALTVSVPAMAQSYYGEGYGHHGYHGGFDGWHHRDRGYGERWEHHRPYGFGRGYGYGPRHYHPRFYDGYDRY